MDFALPKEFEQFVSSAEDLLKQFDGNVSSEGIVNAAFYWDRRGRGVQGGTMLETALRYQRCINDCLQQQLGGYIWHNEPFQLAVSFDYKGFPTLVGSAKIGEYVDDEWFIVHLLLLVSSAFPELVISVCDNDGQFLLMEGADYIDDRLGPDNAENRVWIRKGCFHIIPVDEPGRLKSGGMKLESAVDCILDDSKHSTTVACEGFHRAIRARTTDVYPAKVLADAHTAMCIVPLWLSRLLATHPNVVARAVNAFCAADKDTLRKASTVAASTAPAQQQDDWVAVPVRFTRALYAQLTFKNNFHPPRQYHGIMRRMAAARSRKVTHAFDLGCRLVCGIDCALHADSQTKTRASGARDTFDADEAVWQEVLAMARKDGYLSAADSEASTAQRTTALRQLFDSRQLMSVANYDNYRVGDSAYPTGFAVFLRQALSGASSDSVSVPLSEEEHDQRTFCAVQDGQAGCDSDEWLYLSPEELDRELQQRLDRFRTSAQTPSETGGVQTSGPTTDPDRGLASNREVTTEETEATKPEEGSAEDAEQLQRMLDGLKSFMAGSSDLDGVATAPAGRPGQAIGATRAPDAHKDTPSHVDGVAGSSVSSATPVMAGDGGLQLDFALLDSLLQAVDLTGTNSAIPVPPALPGSIQPIPSVRPAPGAATGAAESETVKGGDDLAGYFTKEDLEDGEDDRDGAESSDSDSDDGENNDRQGERSADAYLQQILTANARVAQAKGAEQAAQAAVGGAVLGVGGGVLRSSGTQGARPTSRRVEAVDSDDESEAAESAAGGGPIRGAAPWGGESDSEVDSDDEGGEGEGEGNGQDLEELYASLDPQTIREFQKLMDAELFGQSSLAETFEWKDRTQDGEEEDDTLGGDDVDVDLTVLKNLMEAQAQAMGSPMAGPLGHLMSQLGITLPTPPPMHGSGRRK